MGRMLDQLLHQGRVNELLLAGGHVAAPGKRFGLLTDEELRLHALAFDAGVTPETFVANTLAERKALAAKSETKGAA